MALERREAGKAGIFAMLGYKPRTAEVARFHNSEARRRIASAPARTSKSYSAAYELISHAIPEWYVEKETGKFAGWGESRWIWLIGPDYKTIKEWDYIWRELVDRRAQNGLGSFYQVETRSNTPQHGNMKLVLNFGTSITGEPCRVVIEGKSATNRESLQGEQVYLALFSEAAEIDEIVWERYMRTRTKYALFPTTPKLSAEWLKNMIDAGEADPALSTETFQYDGYANPNYDWDLFEIEKIRAGSRSLTGRAEDDPWFAEQFLGQWTGQDERALPFRKTSFGQYPAHVIDELPPWVRDEDGNVFARTIVSCDYGYSDSCVALIWAIGEREHYVVLGEVYEKQITTYDFVERIRAKCEELKVSPAYYVGDPKQPQIADIMRRRGLPVWDVDRKAMADRAAGFTALVDALSIDPISMVPRMRFASEVVGKGFGCPKAIREVSMLRRKQGTNAKEWSEGALIGDDHATDALRYGIQSRPRPAAMKGVADWISAHTARLRRRPAQAAAMRGPLAGAAASLNRGAYA